MTRCFNTLAYYYLLLETVGCGLLSPATLRFVTGKALTARRRCVTLWNSAIGVRIQRNEFWMHCCNIIESASCRCSAIIRKHVHCCRLTVRFWSTGALLRKILIPRGSYVLTYQSYVTQFFWRKPQYMNHLYILYNYTMNASLLRNSVCRLWKLTDPIYYITILTFHSSKLLWSWGSRWGEFAGLFCKVAPSQFRETMSTIGTKWSGTENYYRCHRDYIIYIHTFLGLTLLQSTWDDFGKAFTSHPELVAPATPTANRTRYKDIINFPAVHMLCIRINLLKRFYRFSNTEEIIINKFIICLPHGCFNLIAEDSCQSFFS